MTGIGAGAGFFLSGGNPIGAMAGGAIGSAIGNIYAGTEGVYQANQSAQMQYGLSSNMAATYGAPVGTPDFWQQHLHSVHGVRLAQSAAMNLGYTGVYAQSASAYSNNQFADILANTVRNGFSEGDINQAKALAMGGVALQSAIPGLRGQNMADYMSQYVSQGGGGDIMRMMPQMNTGYTGAGGYTPGRMQDTPTKIGEFNSLMTDENSLRSIASMGGLGGPDVEDAATKALLAQKGIDSSNPLVKAYIDKIKKLSESEQGTLAGFSIAQAKAGAEASSLSSSMMSQLAIGKIDRGGIISSTEGIATAKGAEIEAINSRVAFLQSELDNPANTGPYRKYLESLKAQAVAEAAGKGAEVSQLYAGSSGAVYGIESSAAGVTASLASQAGIRAGLTGGPEGVLSGRQTQYGALQEAREAIGNYVNNGDGAMSTEKRNQLTAQYNELTAQQVALMQRANEEFSGLTAALAGTRSGLAMSAFGNMQAQGSGPMASVGAAGGSLSLQKTNISSLQEMANTRLQAIQAKGEDPNQNIEYQNMLGQIQAAQGQLIGEQNTLAAPGLSANSRLTTAQAQHVMTIAQMLPGTGVSMYQSAITIANQANRNINELNMAYAREVRDNGGETPEMQYRHQMQIMHEQETQVGAISSVTTGIEGRMITASTNFSPSSGMVDPSFSRRAAYGAGWKGVPLYTGMGTTPGDLRAYSSLLGRTTSYAGSDATPEQGMVSGYSGALGMNGNGPQSVRVDGPMHMIVYVQYPDGHRERQNVTAYNDSAKIGGDSGTSAKQSYNAYGGVVQH